MKKKILYGALLGALGMAQTVFAQDYDDRWYIHGGTGYEWFDNDRHVDDDWYGTLGVGRFWSPNWAVDIDLNYVNPEQKGNDLHWSMYGLGVSGRYYFRQPEDTWRPFLKVGAGVMRHEDDYSDPYGGRPRTDKYNNLFADAGAGLQATYGRVDVRTEVGARFDFDDERNNDSHYVDFLAGVGVVVRLGPEVAAVAAEPEPTPAPEPAPVTTCADLDDDGDGVNNCDDKCPNSQAGQAVGPDGCPVPVTIDLRGVNFDFDKSTLRPDAISTLNEAISVLKQYPDLRVEVAGHTDSIGTEQYNQGLSERRARAVYDYLMENGIDAARMVGPVGYGELRPIAPNTTPDGKDNPEGRAQNRRTELNVQNQ